MIKNIIIVVYCEDSENKNAFAPCYMSAHVHGKQSFEICVLVVTYNAVCVWTRNNSFVSEEGA